MHIGQKPDGRRVVTLHLVEIRRKTQSRKIKALSRMRYTLVAHCTLVRRTTTKVWATKETRVRRWGLCKLVLRAPAVPDHLPMRRSIPTLRDARSFFVGSFPANASRVDSPSIRSRIWAAQSSAGIRKVAPLAASRSCNI